MSNRIGFQVDREVKVEGPFRLDVDRYVNVVCARAYVEVQGRQYPVVVAIAGTDEILYLPGRGQGNEVDAEREEARALFAIIELIRRPTKDFERTSIGTLPEVRVSLPKGPSSEGKWALQEIREHSALKGYCVTQGKGAVWEARPF